MSKIGRFADGLMSVYGFLKATDKLMNWYQNERFVKEDKELKKFRKKHREFTDYERFIFETQDAAIDFLDRLRDILMIQGCVTVSDAYILKGMAPTLFDTKIGWTELYDDQVKIKKEGNGYKIKFPRPMYIDRKEY